MTPSGAANYTTSHNQVELVLQPQVVKTGEVRVSACRLVQDASDCVVNSSLCFVYRVSPWKLKRNKTIKVKLNTCIPYVVCALY